MRRTHARRGEGDSGLLTLAVSHPGWQAGRARTLTVTLVQKASGLDPAENLAALDDVVAEAFSGSSPRPDLVVLPEVFMRDFGKPGSDIGAFAEDLDGPFVRRLRQKAEEYDVTLVAGMFERSEDPARPYNTLVVVDGAASGRRTGRSISTTPSATRSPTGCSPAPWNRSPSTSTGSVSG